MSDLRVWCYQDSDYIVAESREDALRLFSGLWQVSKFGVEDDFYEVDSGFEITVCRDPYLSEDEDDGDYPMTSVAEEWAEGSPWGHAEGKPYVILDGDIRDDDQFWDDDDPFFDAADYDYDYADQPKTSTVHLGFRMDCPCEKRFGKDCQFCKGEFTLTKWVPATEDEDGFTVARSEVGDQIDDRHAYRTILGLGYTIVPIPVGTLMSPPRIA